MMFADSMRMTALPLLGCGVGMVFTSGGWLVEVRTRARCVAGSVWVEVIFAVGEVLLWRV